MLIDFTKKFYTSNNDILLLETQQAIKEAIINILQLNANDIPLTDMGANISDYQLQLLNHPQANNLVKEVKKQINKIEYVKDSIVSFNYKAVNKNLNINVTLYNKDNSLDMSINLDDLEFSNI
jgi:hypothetical protein